MTEKDVVVTADVIFEKTVDATVKSTVTISAMSRTSKDGAENGRVTMRSGVNKMAEYIDRQAAIDAVGDVHPLDYNSRAIANRLKSLPSADVEPVRHGRWINGGYVCGETEWICSECGFSEWRTSNSRMKFCMNCGARMDGEQDG